MRPSLKGAGIWMAKTRIALRDDRIAGHPNSDVHW